MPRGLGREEARDEELEPLALPNRDWVDDEKFDEVVATAESLATGYVEQIRDGRGRPQPARRQVPLVLHLRPDLPHGPQGRRGRRRGRWRGVSRTPEQRAAIDRRDRDVFLRAGAGTGKTGVLVDRYCAAVADDGISPEAILAFTFTERAAGELRRRVRAELVRRAAEAKGPDGDPELAQRLDDAIRGLGAAPITTIHGFCRRLLSAHPVAAGLDPRFRVLDASEATRVAWAAFDVALEDLIAEDDGTAERVVAVYRVDRVRDLIRGVFEELRSRGEEPELPPITPRDLAAAVQRMRDDGGGGGGRGGRQRRPERLLCPREGAGRAARRAPADLRRARRARERQQARSVPERQACLDAIAEAIAIAAEPGQGMEVYGVFGRAPSPLRQAL